MNALNVLCAQPTRDLFAIAKFMFCREMLCIALAMLSQDVCPSVFCWNGWTFRLPSPSGSHTVLDILYHTVWQRSDGEPVTGASNAGVVWKNRDFQPISHFISQMITKLKIELYSQWPTNRKSYTGLQWDLWYEYDVVIGVPVISNDLERPWVS